MNTTSSNPPLLVAVFDLFAGHQSRTLHSVADQLDVSERAAVTALERLEHLDVLVRARGGTSTPVWKLCPNANTNRFVNPT